MVSGFSMPLWIRAFCLTILLVVVSISISSQTHGSQGADPAGKAGKAALEDAKVTPPRVLYHPDPEYPQEARRAKNQGTCILSLTIGTDGLPHDIKVLRGLGMGLDESAVATARTWRYQPAPKDAKPVEPQTKVRAALPLHGETTDKIPKISARPNT